MTLQDQPTNNKLKHADLENMLQQQVEPYVVVLFLQFFTNVYRILM